MPPLPVSALSVSQFQQKQNSLKNMSNTRYAEHMQSTQNAAGTDHETGNTSTLAFRQLTATDGQTTLQYTKDFVGTKPNDGWPLYIAMHGGGGENPPQNWRQADNNYDWWEMSTYYKGAVSNALYVATRGIGNNWCLHFTAQGYVLMEKLIENMILFENVDPNRVYILGFSAGGDGVYRMSTRLTQRFAAANMSAGNSGGVKFDNLINLPICLQVGENDTGANRNLDVAKRGLELDGLKGNSTSYLHSTFIHPNGDHNSWEDQNVLASHAKYKVFNSVKDWQTAKQAGNSTSTLATSDAVANAVDWVNSFPPRDPLPAHVIWELSLSDGEDCSWTADNWSQLSAKSQNYWLDIGSWTAADVAKFGTRISASIDKNSNTITVDSAKTYLRILLRDNMLNFSQPVHVKIGNQTLDVNVSQVENPMVIQQTLVRNDPNYIFNRDIILTQASNGQWSWSTTPVPEGGL